MNAANLRTILGHLGVEVRGKTQKQWLLAACPFAPFLHEKSVDRRPSFNVKVNPHGISGFKCFSCHQKGSITKLIRKLEHYREEDLAWLALLSESFEIPQDFGDFEEEDIEHEMKILDPHLYSAMFPLATEEPECVAFLKRRRVSRKAAELIQLQFDPEARRCLFPVRDFKGDLLGFSGRSIIPDDRRRRDVAKVKDYAGLKKNRVILGEELIRHDVPPSFPILVVEGLLAYARLISEGVREHCDPVATLGSHMSVDQRDILVSYDRPIVMAYDNDSAGNDGLFGVWDKQAMKHSGGGAIDLLRDHVPVGIAHFPNGKEDPDELTREDIDLIFKSRIEMV